MTKGIDKEVLDRDDFRERVEQLSDDWLDGKKVEKSVRKMYQNAQERTQREIAP